MSNLKRVLKGDDAAAIRQTAEVLTRAAHKLAESMYRQPGAAHAGEPQAEQGGRRTRAKAPGDDDVVDAEYQEVA
jgi:molecular chaperone DnaK